jgi:glyoxylase-like metal-dependent hydrolase (beta-lactamase superfamily II)
MADPARLTHYQSASIRRRARHEAHMSATIKLGDITVHPVVEMEGPYFDALEFFPKLTRELLAENRSWLEPNFIQPETGRLMVCVQGFVIRTPHHNILIDSCVGNHKPRPARPFWHMMNSDRFGKSLAAAGLTVNDIDYVMCTHLHVDHVGWNTRLDNGRWVPTFPNARYVMADRELAFWTQKEKEDPSALPWITDSVLPIVAARREQVVKSDFALSEQVRCIPTPGHTIDHYSVLVGRSGNDAFIAGDMIHSPIQAKYPDIAMRADYDGKQSSETRRRIFDRFCETDTLICVTHFPTPSTGRVRRWGAGYRFVEA